ncbi:MAG: RNA-binding protein [Deltaproteobacteria bacterium]|nr:RNA-binding protein [Deltaproteobacteria bacterium]
MSTKIFVGNLPWSYSSDDLTQLFDAHGEVLSAKVITDRISGRSRGFGFVEMADEEEAKAAIAATNGTESEGRTLTVDVARERPPRRDEGY